MGDRTPCTQRIANRAIVCHVLDSLRAGGVSEVAVVGPSDTLPSIRSTVEDEGGPPVELTYVPHDGRPDLFSSLATVAPMIGDAPCVVHLADGVAGQSLAPFVDLLRDGCPDLVLLLHHSSDPRVRLGTGLQRLLGVNELDDSRTTLGLAGIRLFGAQALTRAYASAPVSHSELCLVEIAERIAACGGQLHVGRIRDWQRYHGGPLDLLEMDRIVLDQLPEAGPVGGSSNRIVGRVSAHPTAVVESSVIMGPSVIGARARITNAYIGPYTTIGTDVLVEGSEIERSIISDGAKIMHVSERIQGSTVGPRAHIFHDFGLPRAMRLHVGRDAELRLS